MTASLKDRITDDMKAAMRAKDAPRLSAIRMLTAAIKQREVDERKDLTDADVVGIVDKQLKQRRDSIAQFEKGGRQDLADHEKFEVSVLEAYMPQALSEVEVTAAIAAAIAESGAKAPADMGKVMALLKPRLAGRTDMSKVSGLVKAQLSAGG
ncbi:MAG: GatB/YqeY domain-containing protein [Burkholderiales bacterium]